MPNNKNFFWIVIVFIISALNLYKTGYALAELDCVIEPHKTVEVSSATTGVLASVLVDRGERVKKGQLLARLQSGVEEASVKLAEIQANSQVSILEKQARYELSQRSQARIEGLSKKNTISELERDEARTRTTIAQYELEQTQVEHQIAQLELKRAQEILKLRSILSPVDGIVVERFKLAGEYVEKQPILKLAEVDLLNVEVVAPVTLFGRIKLGMQAQVIPEEPISGHHIAKVVVVDPIVDAASGTFGIRLHLPNPGYKIPAGLHCQVQFME